MEGREEREGPGGRRGELVVEGLFLFFDELLENEEVAGGSGVALLACLELMDDFG